MDHPDVRVLAGARERVRITASSLVFGGLFVMLVPFLAGALPLVPGLIITVAVGGDLTAVYAVLTLWGAAPLIAAVSALPAALCLIFAGLELYRLRSAVIAWACLALVVPLGFCALAAQVILTPCTGIPSALLCFAVVLGVTLPAVGALNELKVTIGFRAYRSLKERERPT